MDHFNLNAANWWLTVDGNISGPYDVDGIIKCISNGSVSGETYAWQDGMEEWRKIADITPLFSAIVSNEEDEIDFPEFRPSLNEMLSGQKRMTEDGIAEVFDMKEKKWMSETEYQNLLIEEEIAVLTGTFNSNDTVPKGDLATSTTLEDSGTVFDGNSNNLQEDLTSETINIDDNNTKQMKKRAYRERLKARKATGDFICISKISAVYVNNVPEFIEGEDPNDSSKLTRIPVDEQILLNHFRRAGAIRSDPMNPCGFKVKMYKDHLTNQLKGDALITYVDDAAAHNAVKFLDGSFLDGNLRSNINKLHVEVAKFEKKEQVHKSEEEIKKSKALSQALKREDLRQKHKWDDLDDMVVAAGSKSEKGRNDHKSKAKHLKIAVVRNAYSLDDCKSAELNGNASIFYNEIEHKWFEKAMQLTSDAKKATALKRHPWGVVCVRFGTADACINFILACQGFNNKVEVSIFDAKMDLGIMCLPEFAEHSENSTSQLNTTGSKDWEDFLMKDDSTSEKPLKRKGNQECSDTEEEKKKRMKIDVNLDLLSGLED